MLPGRVRAGTFERRAQTPKGKNLLLTQPVRLRVWAPNCAKRFASIFSSARRSSSSGTIPGVPRSPRGTTPGCHNVQVGQFSVCRYLHEGQSPGLHNLHKGQSPGCHNVHVGQSPGCNDLHVGQPRRVTISTWDNPRSGPICQASCFRSSLDALCKPA